MKFATITNNNPQLAGRQTIYDALVLDAGLRQSLAIVRSLGSRGLQIAALESVDRLPAPTFSSRWCQHKFVSPTHQGTQDYLAYLEQVLDAASARVLITSSDGTIALVRQYRKQLEQRVRIALAREPALGIAIDKEQTLAIAKRLGIGIPRAVTLKVASDTEAALREIGLPAVVKPAESWNGEIRVISQPVTTPDEAKQAVEDLTRFGKTVLFQQYLSGRRESLSFFYANKEFYARFAFYGKRTHPPLGGIYVMRQSIAMPRDTGDQAERLIREIDLEGYSQVEFRRDSAGKPYLMEINPRINQAIAHAVSAGVDFPYLLYQWAAGERLTPVKNYRIGSQMRYLSGDILALATSWRQRGRVEVTPPAQATFDFFRDFFMPTEYDYLDQEDLLPAWTATRGFIGHVLRRAGKHFINRLHNTKADASYIKR